MKSLIGIQYSYGSYKNYITKDPFVGFKISFKKTNRVYINKDELYILKKIKCNAQFTQ